ncbi:MAG: metallophosphoesterase family protein, partial [Myxococcota bacterium]
MAIISDVHSNIEALTVALDWIDTHEVDHIYCLGDVVGYGADPNPCCD